MLYSRVYDIAHEVREVCMALYDVQVSLHAETEVPRVHVVAPPTTL